MRSFLVAILSLSLLIAGSVSAQVVPDAAAPPAKVAPAAKVTVEPAAKVTVEPAAKAPAEEPKAEEPKEEPKAAATVSGEVKWWEEGLSHLMKLGFLLLSLLASGLITVLMKKYGFEDQSAKVNELLGKAVGYAEQKAIKAAKLEEGKKTSGAEKMNLAVQFAQKMAGDYKLKEKGSDWWEDKLESWLGLNGTSEG